MDPIALPTAAELPEIERRWADAAALSRKLSHDFDNLLTGIVGFSELTLPLLAEGSMAHENVREVLAVGRRAFGLTKQMHLLSRVTQSSKLPSLPSALLEAQAAEARKEFPLCEFRVESPGSRRAAPVETFWLAAALRQVVTNAAEAMPKGGVVEASCRDVSAAEWQKLVPNPLGEFAADRGIVVEIRDSGIGFSSEAQSSVFRVPYFSLKPRHLGVGLGMVMRLICRHGGAFGLRSRLGVGSAVLVAVPALDS